MTVKAKKDDGILQLSIMDDMTILRPVKFAENEEGIILKFKHKT